MSKVELPLRVIRGLKDDGTRAKLPKAFRRFIETMDGRDPDHFAFAEFCWENKHRSRSKDFQDLWVLYESTNLKTGTFIELGAADGIKKSNSYLLEENGWRGICIEPRSELFELLMKNRTCATLQYAATSKVRSFTKFAVLMQTTALPTSGSLSLRKSVHRWVKDRKLGRFELIRTKRFSTIVTEALQTRVIDYLSLDTEGRELSLILDLLKGGFKIRLISIEVSSPRIAARTTRSLARFGYKQRFPGVGRNDLFFKLIES